jgi:hypothetical protein
MRRAQLWFLLAALSAPSFVRAQEAEDEASSDDESGEEVGEAQPPAAAERDKVPPSGAPAWWFGAYLQDTFVPSFMLQLFLDEAPAVNNVGFGFTVEHRNPNGVSFVLGLGYAGYGFDGPYRAKGDPDTDTEYLHSTLGLLHLRGQLLWTTEIVPNTLSFDYGVGIDVGVVLGSIERTEAYRDVAGNFQPCVGVGNPNAIYCEPTASGSATDAYNAMGAHYHVVEKRVPPVALIPMIPALSLRYTPVRSVAIKLDAAFGLLQFAFGLSAAYGVDL